MTRISSTIKQGLICRMLIEVNTLLVTIEKHLRRIDFFEVRSA